MKTIILIFLLVSSSLYSQISDCKKKFDIITPSKNDTIYYYKDKYFDITWNVGNTLVVNDDSLSIYYSKDFGKSWNLITDNVSMSSTSYKWRTPKISSDLMLVKIKSNRYNTINAESENFTMIDTLKKEEVDSNKHYIFSAGTGLTLIDGFQTTGLSTLIKLDLPFIKNKFTLDFILAQNTSIASDSNRSINDTLSNFSNKNTKNNLNFYFISDVNYRLNDNIYLTLSSNIRRTFRSTDVHMNGTQTYHHIDTTSHDPITIRDSTFTRKTEYQSNYSEKFWNFFVGIGPKIKFKNKFFDLYISAPLIGLDITNKILGYRVNFYFTENTYGIRIGGELRGVYSSNAPLKYGLEQDEMFLSVSKDIDIGKLINGIVSK